MRPAAWIVATTCRVVTVDRVEADVAVLDWCGRVRTDAPLFALPADVAEGDRLRLHPFPAPRRARSRGHSALAGARSVHPEGACPPLQEYVHDPDHRPQP